MVKYFAEEIIKMKRIAVLVLVAVLLCSCAAALAEAPAIPSMDSFAAMTTMTKNSVITVTLSKPVDKLYINWPNELKVVELAVNQNLQATASTVDQDSQPGVAKKVTLCDPRKGDKEILVATDYDRAFVTLQGEWIVCYNRKGRIVDVAPAGAADIQAIRDVAFQSFREPAFSGYGIVRRGVIMPAPQMKCPGKTK